MNGTIKRVIMEKGFGFIQGEDGQEYFFHPSGLKNSRFDSLTSGMQVTFEETSTNKGLRAEEIFVESN